LATSADESVFAFYKQKGESTVVVVLNFSADAQTVMLALPEAELAPVMGSYGVTGWDEGQEMAPYSYAVLATAS
jgi:glycosidase